MRPNGIAAGNIGVSAERHLCRGEAGTTGGGLCPGIGHRSRNGVAAGGVSGIAAMYPKRERERHCGRGERSDLFFSWLAGCGEAGLRVGGAEEGATLGAAGSCFATGGAVAAAGGGRG